MVKSRLCVSVCECACVRVCVLYIIKYTEFSLHVGHKILTDTKRLTNLDMDFFVDSVISKFCLSQFHRHSSTDERVCITIT
jgi:hypothetical protein